MTIYVRVSALCVLFAIVTRSSAAAEIARVIIICPIAIAYSMGQIIKSVCVCVSVCLSVCLSVCGHSHGRIS